MLIFLTTVVAQLQSVSINEIAWMGDSDNWRNEWIEIKNNTSYPISLENWILMVDDKKTNLSGEIGSNAFFLIAKKESKFHGCLFKGSLNNNGNRLTLLDPSNRIVDKVDFSSGWPGGDNETKRTLEKSENGDWQTSLNVGGTPGKENSKLNIGVKKISNIEISRTERSSSNDFNKIFLKGAFVAFFITIISLYLNLKIKEYSINN
jgi:hypothetical protein